MDEMAIENAIIEAAELELGNCTLLLALRGPGGIRRISVALQADQSNTLPRVLGTTYLTQLPGRAVRVRVEGDQVQDIGNILTDDWLKGEARPPADSAAELELDPTTEP